MTLIILLLSWEVKTGKCGWMQAENPSSGATTVAYSYRDP
jgi:hypothetical protein